MKLKEFQQFFVDNQKNYDFVPSNSILLSTLGLAGEVGEVIEIIKKAIRDRNLNKTDLELELGDILAYLSLLCEYCQ
jgi:NTP pyrophosphatase (non-canonical NTP hydrolase)